MFGEHASGLSAPFEAEVMSRSIHGEQPTTNRTRWFQARYRIAWALVIASVFVVLFAAWAAAYRIAELNHRSNEYTYTTVVIQKGDTLWDIAVQYGPKGWDPRKTVHHIAELNQITPESYGKLLPGDRLAVPISLNAHR